VRDNTLADFENADDMFGAIANGAAETEGPQKSKPRTMAELRKFIEQRLPGPKQEWNMDPAITEFLKAWKGYMLGKRTETSLDNALIKLLNAEVTGVDDSEAA
jgi:hypothetical protein